MLETDTDLFALVTDISGIDDPFTELERLASAHARPMSGFA